MDIRIVQRIIGLLLMGFSLTMVLPLSVSLYLDDGIAYAFESALAILFLSGTAIWFPARHYDRDLRLRDGFLVVAGFWISLGLAGALPFWLTMQPSLSFTDAAFESISGLTTTGATILTGLEHLPPSILLYRHQLQWLGGMGVVVLAVAVLPILGVGGMSLYRAETPGPVKDAKLTPRIQETAKALWAIYLGMTVACAAAYWLAGMGGLEAVGHAFSTISTGGFSSHDASMAYFGSLRIEAICIFFMAVGGVNFALHFAAIRGRKPLSYLRDPEFRLFLKILVGIIFICTVYLTAMREEQGLGGAFRDSVFQVVSVMTSTGFTTANFSAWPAFLPALLMFVSMVGGSAGSTAGGMKVIRVYMIFKQLRWEVQSLVHPRAIPVVKVGGRLVENRTVRAVWGFFVAYAVMYGVLMVMLMITGLDAVTAFSAVAATINNLGPGLGDVASNFITVTDAGKWLAMYAMLLGRLEIFTLLVIFTPAFWRH